MDSITNYYYSHYHYFNYYLFFIKTLLMESSYEIYVIVIRKYNK